GVFTASQYQEENEYEIGNSFLIDKSIIREISIIPNLGFFIKDNTSLGLGIGYKNSFESYEYNSRKFDRESNLVEVKVFARFHKPVTESFYLFIQPMVKTSFGVGKNIDEDKENILGLGVGVTPGIVYMLSKKVGLEASFGFIGYDQETRTLKEPALDSNPKNVTKDYGIDLSLKTLQLGLQFYFE
ncbi:MAG: hypothetical protein CMO01_23100, partial [Thalassobius sp.]|nr:hypothetical protein [Thalassovita sp.]